MNISGNKTLKEHEYHIGIGSHVNINRVVVCTMCRNPKNHYRKKGWKRA